jgi:hypothetical protein
MLTMNPVSMKSLRDVLLDPATIRPDTITEIQQALQGVTTTPQVLRSITTLFATSDPAAHYSKRLNNVTWRRKEEDASRLASRIRRLVSAWVTARQWSKCLSAPDILPNEAGRKACSIWTACMKKDPKACGFLPFLGMSTATASPGSGHDELRLMSDAMTSMMEKSVDGQSQIVEAGTTRSNRRQSVLEATRAAAIRSKSRADLMGIARTTYPLDKMNLPEDEKAEITAVRLRQTLEDSSVYRRTDRGQDSGDHRTSTDRSRDRGKRRRPSSNSPPRRRTDSHPRGQKRRTAEGRGRHNSPGRRAYRTAAKDARPCYAWRDDGKCKWGENCRFTHY